jgi:hypothetical protein
MIIGFLSAHVDALIFYKDCVREFPTHDYYAYIDPSDFKKRSSLKKAVTWLISKKVDCVVIGEGLLIENVKSLFVEHKITLMHTHELKAHLKKAKADTKEQSEYVRAIHITQYEDNQDKAVADILGGYFIKD